MQNLNSEISGQIASHYVAAREIPPENVCRIYCSTAEIVSEAECEASIVAPIRAFLQQPAIAERIDYIVLTKGIPLAADYGYSTGPLSVSSILTCVGEPPREGHPGITEPIENPYGPTVWMYPVVEEAFSHSYPFMVYTGGDFYECHLYLVTRLDGYTLDDVLNLIDRSVSATPAGPTLLDRRANPPPAYVPLNDMLTDARDVLAAKGLPVIYDDTAEFIGSQTNLMGYFSWGSNDPSYTLELYTSNTFAPGSIADTYVSSSGRTFNPTSGGQSLIADLIPLGACGVNGYTSEPYVGYATYPHVLFDRYTTGYNMAESFYAACPELYWKSVVVGDPLMAPYGHKPQVSIVSPETPLTGVATVSAEASDPDGIAKVEFFFDGVQMGFDVTEPYTVEIDTTQYTVGPHALEATAYQATPQAVQASCTATVTVENPISNLTVIADAFPSCDGQGVRATEKVVTVGTAEMGGGEFYIEEPDRSSGIRIISTEQVNEADVVNIEGDLTTESGERSISATSVAVVHQLLTPLKPFAMPNGALGGGDLTPDTKGVTGGVGARNVGLLVTTWGRVTYVGGADEEFFYIDDGSGLEDGSGHVGVKVGCRDLEKPQLGWLVTVTGLSACEELGDCVIRLLKPRRQSDISPIAQ